MSNTASIPCGDPYSGTRFHYSPDAACTSTCRRVRGVGPSAAPPGISAAPPSPFGSQSPSRYMGDSSQARMLVKDVLGGMDLPDDSDDGPDVDYGFTDAPLDEYGQMPVCQGCGENDACGTYASGDYAGGDGSPGQVCEACLVERMEGGSPHQGDWIDVRVYR